MFGFSMTTVYLVGALIVATLIGVAGYKGYQLGGDHERVACNERVRVIQKKIDDANAEIEKIKKETKEKIDQIIADNDEKAKQREDENDALEKKLFEAEAKYAGATDCLLDKSTVDELQ